MLKDITFGQYRETYSCVHKLDPRTKLLLLIIIIVFLFIASDFYALGLIFAFVLGVIFTTKINVGVYLKNLKSIWLIIVFTSVINLFYGDGGKVLLDLGFAQITSSGVFRALFMALRISLLIIISSILTYTTTPNNLTDGLEKLLSPLRFIGLKNAVHTLAMMMTIALRFIPTLVEETQKIMNAQKARGADLENGKLIDKIRALIPILIPLLISSIRRAYELAEAMECRCYNGGEGRVRMKQLRFTVADLIATVITLTVCAGVFVLRYI